MEWVGLRGEVAEVIEVGYVGNLEMTNRRLYQTTVQLTITAMGLLYKGVG